MAPNQHYISCNRIAATFAHCKPVRLAASQALASKEISGFAAALPSRGDEKTKRSSSQVGISGNRRCYGTAPPPDFQLLGAAIYKVSNLKP